MLKSKGMTLVETLLAFSIFISVVIIVLTCYTTSLHHYQDSINSYNEYLTLLQKKELELWQSNTLQGMLEEVLP